MGWSKNPLAVDLCKVALWIEGHSRGKPLTFLDYHIRCGDSLVGVLDLAVLDEGIPDAAFEPVSGDDKTTARGLKKQNKEEREGQMSLFDQLGGTAVAPDAAEWEAFTQMPEDTPAQINAKRARYRELLGRGERARTAANLWTAAFFSQLTAENLPNVPTSDALRRYRDGQPVSGQVVGAANALAEAGRFFHWPLEFPQVFATPPVIPRSSEESHSPGHSSSSGFLAPQTPLGMTTDLPPVIPTSPRGGIPTAQEERDSSPKTARNDMGSGGGFDAVLGNPPWERIKLQEQEFFATRDAEIATAANKAARERLIKQLPRKNPPLARAFAQGKHAAEATSKFVRQSERFPLTARGDINVYTLFVELTRQIITSQGRASMICPPGIASDDTTKIFFNDLMENQSLVSLIAFVNEKMIFPEVLHNFRFCIFSLTGADLNVEQAQFAYECQTFADIKQIERLFTLTVDDLMLVNPNTRTAPVFRTRADAELTKKIYRSIPVLDNETNGNNLWQISFMTMFHMSGDSSLFQTANELTENYRLLGNRFVNENEVWLPLYEGKLIYQFDHRFASFETTDGKRAHMLPPVQAQQHQCPDYFPLSHYYVSHKSVANSLEGKWHKNWLMGFREVTSKSLARSVIFSILPVVGVGHKIPLLLFDQSITSLKVACFLGCVNCLTFDYLARQKIGGASLSNYILKQIPAIPPGFFNNGRFNFVVPRILELVYTAWDIAPFAADLWHEADEPLRRALRAQWEANRQATGGHQWPADSEPWTVDGGQKPPFPPFKWEDDRRAQLRAELDAYYARLYGLTRDELRYILDPADVYGPEFPGETFRVLKEKEIKAHGEYRTQRLVLAAWDAQEAAIARGELVFEGVGSREVGNREAAIPYSLLAAPPAKLKEEVATLALERQAVPAQSKPKPTPKPSMNPALDARLLLPGISLATKGSYSQRLKRVQILVADTSDKATAELVVFLAAPESGIQWVAETALGKRKNETTRTLLQTLLKQTKDAAIQTRVQNVLENIR